MDKPINSKSVVNAFKEWLDTIDFELIFLNALIIAILVVVIIASDYLLS